MADDEVKEKKRGWVRKEAKMNSCMLKGSEEWDRDERCNNKSCKGGKERDLFGKVGKREIYMER